MKFPEWIKIPWLFQKLATCVRVDRVVFTLKFQSVPFQWKCWRIEGSLGGLSYFQKRYGHPKKISFSSGKWKTRDVGFPPGAVVLFKKTVSLHLWPDTLYIPRNSHPKRERWHGNETFSDRQVHGPRKPAVMKYLGPHYNSVSYVGIIMPRNAPQSRNTATIPVIKTGYQRIWFHRPSAPPTAVAILWIWFK